MAQSSGQQLTPVKVMLTGQQIEYLKSQGNMSRYVRSLIDREMGMNMARSCDLARILADVRKTPAG